jgi:L-asparagine transporter-like permease
MTWSERPDLGEPYEASFTASERRTFALTEWWCALAGVLLVAGLIVAGWVS